MRKKRHEPTCGDVTKSFQEFWKDKAMLKALGLDVSERGEAVAFFIYNIAWQNGALWMTRESE